MRGASSRLDSQLCGGEDRDTPTSSPPECLPRAAIRAVQDIRLLCMTKIILSHQMCIPITEHMHVMVPCNPHNAESSPPLTVLLPRHHELTLQRTLSPTAGPGARPPQASQAISYPYIMTSQVGLPLEGERNFRLPSLATARALSGAETRRRLQMAHPLPGVPPPRCLPHPLPAQPVHSSTARP